MNRLIVASLLACGALAAGAAEEKKAEGFKTGVTVGGTLSKGNTETVLGNAAVLTEGEKEGLGSVRAGIEGNYGESTAEGVKSRTVENAKAFANVKKTLSPKTFGYLDGSVLSDGIARIDYRATLGPGAGVYLVKNDRTSLSVELGPSYIWERVAGVTDDYLAVRVAERFEQALGEKSKLWQSAEYLPKAVEFGDYLLSGEVGIEAAVNSRMSLRLVLQDKYDSTPGLGLVMNDLSLIGGVAVSL